MPGERSQIIERVPFRKRRLFMLSPLPTQVKELPAEDYAALTGLLYMVASYVVGSRIYEKEVMKGSTSKNLVPFMLKTGWQHLEVPILSKDLIIAIASYFSMHLKEDTKNIFLVSRSSECFLFCMGCP